MTYVIIFTDDGRIWYARGGVTMASRDEGAQLAEMAKLQAEHPTSQFAVKAIDTQLWTAIQCSFVRALYAVNDNED